MTSTQKEQLQKDLQRFLDHYKHYLPESPKGMTDEEAVEHLVEYIQSREAELESKHSREIVAGRLTELDLLEQAINQGRDMYEYKMERLDKLTTQYDALQPQSKLHESVNFKPQPQSNKEETKS